MQSDLSATAVARAAIRRLAERRMPPTPENYAEAWVACGGEPPSTQAMAQAAEAALRLLAERGEIAAPLRAELLAALREPRWEPMAALLAQIEAQPVGDGWRELLPALLSAFETQHAGWTTARKREGVARAIESVGRNPVRLRHRLAMLVESWRRRPEATNAAEADADPPEWPSETGDRASATWLHDDVGAEAMSDVDDRGADAGTEVRSRAGAVAGSDTDADEALRRLDGSERALAEMRRLLLTLCESVGSLSDDGSWLQGQMDTLRDVLRQGGDRRSVSIARQMIEQTAQTQQRLFVRKREALRQLREALTSAVGQAEGLGGSTEEFAIRLARWTQEIERADSIDALDALARGLVGDARTMQATVADSRDGFVAAHQRAQALEHEVARLERELAETSQSMLTDHLTQALNRRGLDDAWSAARLQATRSGQPMSIALLDVDDFKRLNDAFGHLAGDGALKHLARLLQSRLRPGDSVARWGGEEFVLLLPGSDAPAAHHVMQRLQRELTREVYLHEHRQVFLTFSAGVAEVRGNEPFEAVVARADEAMYLAKRAGKNCVMVG